MSKHVNICLFANIDDPWLWHRRLQHANMKLIKNISTKDHVRGIPKLNYQKVHTCEACEIGKQIRASHKAKSMISTSRPLELYGSHRSSSCTKSRRMLIHFSNF